MTRKIIIACLLTLLGSQSVWASTSWYATVDTSSIAGQSGWLDFQFNPADFSAPGASATVSSFNSNGTLLSTVTASGDVSGDLGSALVLGNSQPFNDWLQAYVFGTTLRFLFDLDVPVPNSSGSGTAFSLSLYDSAFNSLLADPVWGAALVANANDNGSVDILGQSAQVSLSTASPVPEPQTLPLFLTGLGLLGMRLRKKSLPPKS